jgi:hypothetical protein
MREVFNISTLYSRRDPHSSILVIHPLITQVKLQLVVHMCSQSTPAILCEEKETEALVIMQRSPI